MLACPKQLSNFGFPGKKYIIFFSLVDKSLPWALDHWASENEKILAWRENLLFLEDCQTTLFSSLD